MLQGIMFGIVIVKTTFPSKESAEKAAKELLDESLAACVQIGPEVESYFVWAGKKCVEKEFPVSIKTASFRLKEVKAKIEQTHPYDCPQIITIKSGASKEYARWVKSSCSRAK